jgi:hypothetical protein
MWFYKPTTIDFFELSSEFSTGKILVSNRSSYRMAYILLAKLALLAYNSLTIAPARIDSSQSLESLRK